LPVHLPPLFPDIEDELEEFLLHPESLHIHSYYRTQKFWDRERDPEQLLKHETTQSKYCLQTERHFKTGEYKGYEEVLASDIGLTAKNSLSFSRQPGAFSNPIKGDSSNYPFMPGGFTLEAVDNLVRENCSENVNFEVDLLDTPPSFDSAIKFDVAEKADPASLNQNEASSTFFDINEIFSGDLEIDGINDWGDDTSRAEEQKGAISDKIEESKEDEIDENMLQVRATEDGHPRKLQEKKKEEWVVTEDAENAVEDFHRLVPDMARKFPFELDTFQKQAILPLERHESVFVAAHTSAGKTVIAEYAIALAQRHMTKVVYTSPIKALSNQKFRDFKNTFQDVGILTGDVQIRPDAGCLVMTTEILRSMLYNGSDVIRDIEWVIFDEVHYINDAMRGVVWEEVLIMLPEHVGIILLSATVPNTYEFADWIGRTKQKKIHVVSTQKRPVPLEHMLFTGNSAKTINELFLLIDSHGKFDKRSYQAAVDAKKARAAKAKDSFGPKGGSQGNPKQDRNIWLSVIEMLKKKEQLPVVAFTFSRKQCDKNANQLTNVDLTTSSEKSSIHVFVHRCIGRLKGSDKELPQVVWITELLKRGIGVHHSGILPILKEVVEMLFQRGLVKLLYATETFAMGVNMPARTVVFDSIRKHDGQNFRDLLPSEYIQMAGRAGRRGLDSTGLVILLCKSDVPDLADLHKMMMGKPTLLQSQFRLTYSMILNVLRVEQLSVEEIMKRSFAEFSHQKDAPEFKSKRKALKKQINEQPKLECQICAKDLEKYYGDWKTFHDLNFQLKRYILGSQAGQRALSPGRVIIIASTSHRNALAIILLQTSLQNKTALSKDPLDKLFTVLVPVNNSSAIHETTEEMKLASNDKITEPFISRKLATVHGGFTPHVEEIRASDIAFITAKQIKIDPSKIIDDHKKRQIPRFRENPPSESTILAAQELFRLLESNPDGVSCLDPIRDFNMKNIDVVENMSRLSKLEASINSYKCVDCPQFTQHFAQIRCQFELREELQRVRYLLSNESLELLPEYQQRIQVLKKLRYIDAGENVKLKGRVACGISNHELIITELVFDNQLNDLHPTEIVALLSCFVCEQKKSSAPELTETLTKGVEMIKKKARELAEIQIDCGISLSVEEYVTSFRVGLVQVVYEWSKGMSFKEITELTDIPEGTIVRCIQRLDETCRDVKSAAAIIGDPVLADKMEQGSSLIKRDIVFAGSLYTS